MSRDIFCLVIFFVYLFFSLQKIARKKTGLEKNTVFAIIETFLIFNQASEISIMGGNNYANCTRFDCDIETNYLILKSEKLRGTIFTQIYTTATLSTFRASGILDLVQIFYRISELKILRFNRLIFKKTFIVFC